MSGTVLSTCDLSDRLESIAQVPAVSFRSFGGRAQFSGNAVTVKCFEDNSRVKELLATEGRARVLVVDGGGSQRCALVGDLIAKSALDNGWAGVVIYGCVRDSAALATFGIGVLALGTCPRRSTRRGEGTVDLPLDIAGARIAPGDLIVADQDGVLVIPASHAEGIVSA
jgi:regulator of ribonuclease activity A